MRIVSEKEKQRNERGREKVNEKCMKTFYTYSSIIHTCINLCFVSGLIVNHYETETAIVSIWIIIVAQIVIIYIVVHILLALTKCITKPTKHVFYFLNNITCSKLYHRFKYALFYEMIHSKKSFKFRFGPFGSITKKNLLTFLVLYSCQLFYFIKTLKRWRKSTGMN